MIEFLVWLNFPTFQVFWFIFSTLFVILLQLNFQVYFLWFSSFWERNWDFFGKLMIHLSEFENIPKSQRNTISFQNLKNLKYLLLAKFSSVFVSVFIVERVKSEKNNYPTELVYFFRSWIVLELYISYFGRKLLVIKFVL